MCVLSSQIAWSVLYYIYGKFEDNLGSVLKLKDYNPQLPIKMAFLIKKKLDNEYLNFVWEMSRDSLSQNTIHYHKGEY